MKDAIKRVGRVAGGSSLLRSGWPTFSSLPFEKVGHSSLRPPPLIHSVTLIAVQPSISTFRRKTLNIFIKVCYPPSVFGDQNPRSITSLARRSSADLPPPSLASGSQRLLLCKLKRPINHAESTLLQVLILKQLKVPLESITFEKPGEGSPLWLTNCSKQVSTQSFPGIPTFHSPYAPPSSATPPSAKLRLATGLVPIRDQGGEKLSTRENLKRFSGGGLRRYRGNGRG
jgi:hypothetical protein